VRAKASEFGLHVPRAAGDDRYPIEQRNSPGPVPSRAVAGDRIPSEFLPNPPITVNKVDLMEQDNVAAPEIPGFGALQIMPQPIEGVLGDILQKRSQVRVTPSDKLRRG